MRSRGGHVAVERLMVLAFGARHPGEDAAETAQDRRALEHVAECGECGELFARMASEAETLRDEARAEADAVFSDAMLDAQRARVLDRIAHLGQAARILTFPMRRRYVAPPRTSSTRRWVSVAAAAGLIVGLVAGQMLHLTPAPGAQETAGLTTANAGGEGITVVPTSASSTPPPMLSEDELLEQIELAVQVRSASALRALDALTPTAADMVMTSR